MCLQDKIKTVESEKKVFEEQFIPNWIRAPRIEQKIIKFLDQNQTWKWINIQEDECDNQNILI